MIDLHSHVLPGVDDGPETMDGSLELLRAAEAAGIGRMAATPHVRDDYPTTPERMHRLVGEVNAAAREAAIAVEVLPGAELDLAAAQELGDEELRSFGLGGNPRLLLLESPYRGWPPGLGDVVFRFAARGFRSRSPIRSGTATSRRTRRCSPRSSSGVRVQLTAASSRRFGRRPQASARESFPLPTSSRATRAIAVGNLRQTGFAAPREEIGGTRARRLADPCRRAERRRSGGPPGIRAPASAAPPRSRGLMRTVPRRRMPSRARREAVSSALRRPPACAATADPPSLDL